MCALVTGVQTCALPILLVPLVHFNTLAGVILLARPPVDRALDWEDFDLLRIAGRQVASYLAEARAQGALADARRFDEFNRRFAFILHDIKNLVSQLSLVARNAERHADNPDFRAAIGRASCRERVCQYVSISVVAVSLTEKKT